MFTLARLLLWRGTGERGRALDLLVGPSLGALEGEDGRGSGQDVTSAGGGCTHLGLGLRGPGLPCTHKAHCGRGPSPGAAGQCEGRASGTQVSPGRALCP